MIILYLNFTIEKMKGEQGRYGSEDILMKLRENQCSAAWFLEQWSINRKNALITFKQLSDIYMGLLIENLYDYLRSQYFFELSNKSKIKGCIEGLQRERQQRKQQEKKNDRGTGSQQDGTLKGNTERCIGIVGWLALIFGAIATIILKSQTKCVFSGVGAEATCSCDGSNLIISWI